MTDASAPFAALEDIPLFQGLSFDGVASLKGRLRVETFPPGSDLLQVGKDTPGLYVLRSGTAAAIVVDASGAEREVATLGRGECLGEMSLISGEPCSATVRAITETETWLLPTEDFLELVTHQPELWRNLGRVLSQRLARTSRHVGTSTRSNVVALVTDLPPVEEAALAVAVGSSLARQVAVSTLIVDANENASGLPLSDDLRMPSLAALISDRRLLSAHEAATPQAPARVCGLIDDANTTISEGDVIAALDWLRPFYERVIICGGRSIQQVQKLWYERSRTIATLISRPTSETPAWLDALLYLPDTARKLDIAVLTAGDQSSRLVQDLEDRRDKAVVRLPISGTVFSELASDPDYSETDPNIRASIDRLARMIGEFEVGLALGAGAAKGFAHIGVLRVLEENNIPIDYISGCSIGSVVGSQYALGVPLDDIARSMRGADKKLSRWTIPLRSVWSNRGLKELLSEPGARIRFSDLKTPFAAVATDVASGREIVLRKGIVWRAVMASTSVPGMFPPVLRGRRQMVDGGLVNPVPSQAARDMGADFVIAVDLMGPAARASERAEQNGGHARVPNLVEMLWRANEIMQEEVTARSAATADITIEPKLGRVRWSDFSRRGRQFIEAGELAAREKLPELLALVPRPDKASAGATR